MGTKIYYRDLTPNSIILNDYVINSPYEAPFRVCFVIGKAQLSRVLENRYRLEYPPFLIEDLSLPDTSDEGANRAPYSAKYVWASNPKVETFEITRTFGIYFQVDVDATQSRLFDTITSKGHSNFYIVKGDKMCALGRDIFMSSSPSAKITIATPSPVINEVLATRKPNQSKLGYILFVVDSPFEPIFEIEIEAYKSLNSELQFRWGHSNFTITEVDTYTPKVSEIRCDCGSDKCGFLVHSFWCPKYREEK